eukprot:1032230-Prorocentrum_minimum.AAC.1
MVLERRGASSGPPPGGFGPPPQGGAGRGVQPGVAPAGAPSAAGRRAAPGDIGDTLKPKPNRAAPGGVGGGIRSRGGSGGGGGGFAAGRADVPGAPPGGARTAGAGDAPTAAVHSHAASQPSVRIRKGALSDPHATQISTRSSSQPVARSAPAASECYVSVTGGRCHWRQQAGDTFVTAQVAGRAEAPSTWADPRARPNKAEGFASAYLSALLEVAAALRPNCREGEGGEG